MINWLRRGPLLSTRQRASRTTDPQHASQQALSQDAAHANAPVEESEVALAGDGDASERRARVSEGDGARAVLQHARELFEEGRVDEALECYREYVGADTTNLDGHLELGGAYRAIGAYANAVAEYRAAASLAPSSRDALRGLAESLVKAGDLYGALIVYEDITARFPTWAGAHAGMAGVYSLLQRHQLAYDAAQKAIQIRPDWPYAYVTLGLVCSGADDLSGAARAYTRAIELKTDYPQAWINLGCILHRSGQREAARAIWQHFAVRNNALGRHAERLLRDY